MRIFPISSIFSLNPCTKENKFKQNIWNKNFSHIICILVVSQYALMHYIQKIGNVQVKKGKKTRKEPAKIAMLLKYAV